MLLFKLTVCTGRISGLTTTAEAPANLLVLTCRLALLMTTARKDCIGMKEWCMVSF
jgi:hypothetical protein